MNAIQQLAHAYDEQVRIAREIQTLQTRAAEEIEAAHRNKTQRARALADVWAHQVAKDQGIPVDFITSRSRADHYVRARAIAYTIARSNGWSLPRIGAWARRDHATIHHALAAYANDPDILEATRRITETMNTQAAA